MPAIQYNNAGGVAAAGNEQSVKMAQDGLERTMNQASVRQMQMMEQQTNQQLVQTLLKQRSDLLNSCKELTGNVRL